MLSVKYEYDEDVYLALDGSATVYVNASVPACDAYLAVELGVAGQCGGRTLERDVIDDTLGAVVGPGVSDYVGNDSTFLVDFPFLGAPN